MAKQVTFNMTVKQVKQLIGALVSERAKYAVDANLERKYHAGIPATVNALKRFDELSALIETLNSAIGNKVAVSTDDGGWTQIPMELGE